jgi:hypothetical protein
VPGSGELPISLNEAGLAKVAALGAEAVSNADQTEGAWIQQEQPFWQRERTVARRVSSAAGSALTRNNTMASNNTRSGFDSLDLAILDSVYLAAWAHLVSRSPAVNEEDEKRQKNLRQRLFALAKPGSVDFDTLYERALASFDQTKITPLVSRSV